MERAVLLAGAEDVMTNSVIVEIDHVSVPVRDLKRARKFYEKALGAIGMKVNLDVPTALGMGSQNQKIFWLARDLKATGHGHYALRVASRAAVKAFYDAAIKAGGKDNGAPGVRPKYGKNYYAAFVKDNEGNNIEIVCYSPTVLAAKSTSTKAKARKSVASARRRTNGSNGRSQRSLSA
jgi:catechol 2,3-dioxygenase-like lactoylglutathione lyase family enzyme